MPLTLALIRQKQVDVRVFKACLIYKANSRKPGNGTQRNSVSKYQIIIIMIVKIFKMHQLK